MQEPSMRTHIIIMQYTHYVYVRQNDLKLARLSVLLGATVAGIGDQKCNSRVTVEA